MKNLQLITKATKTYKKKKIKNQINIWFVNELHQKMATGVQPPHIKNGQHQLQIILIKEAWKRTTRPLLNHYKTSQAKLTEQEKPKTFLVKEKRRRKSKAKQLHLQEVKEIKTI